MKSSGINWVMTVIGFGFSVMFIVFVCTRLIFARIQLRASRRSRSDLSILERGCNGLEPLALANFSTKKYRELCLSSKENACQRCTICLASYHEDDTLSVLPVCGHSFHSTCIGIWLQQNSTCPVCRISLRDVPVRKWYMQRIFCPAVRSEYRMQPVNAHYCHCMANGNRHSSRSDENEIVGPVQERSEVDAGDSNSLSIDHDKICRKVDSPSN